MCDDKLCERSDTRRPAPNTQRLKPACKSCHRLNVDVDRDVIHGEPERLRMMRLAAVGTRMRSAATVKAGSRQQANKLAVQNSFQAFRQISAGCEFHSVDSCSLCFFFFLAHTGYCKFS